MAARSGAPSRFCSSRPAFSPSASGATPPIMPVPPKLQALVIIAPRNRPFDSGLVIWAATAPAPNDWPVITTLFGIAAELRDVVVHPFQRRVLVEIAVVAGMAALLLRQLGMRHVAEHADAIVEVDEDGAALGHVLAVVIGHARRAEGPAAAIDEDDHRAAVAGLGFGRRPDIEVEAVLAGRLLAEIVVDVVGAQHLDAFGPLAVGIPDAVPADRLRRLPAQLAGRRLGEGDSQIGLHAGGQLRARDLCRS